MKKTVLYNLIYPLCALIVFVIVWAIVANAYNKPLIVPNPLEVLQSLGGLIVTQQFYSAVLMTFGRTILGFLLSVAFAWILAELSAVNKVARSVLSPFVVIMRTLPTMSVVLLFTVWFTSKLTPILVCFLIACPLLYSAFVLRLTTNNTDINQMCQVFQISNRTKLLRLYPRILLNEFLRQAGSICSLALKVVIAGEVLAYTANSIGTEMNIAKMNIQTANLIAWTVVAILLSFAIEGIVLLIKRLLRRLSVCPQ